MPSQEDILNELLKEMPEKEDSLAGDGTAPDLDDLAGMSEEQIAMLLAEGEAGRHPEAEETAEDMLELAGRDSDVQEIQELLEKSDRNESVFIPEDRGDEENPADRLMADIEMAGETDVAEKALDIKKEKKAEKKRIKAERKAAKAEKREKRRAKKSGGKKVPQAETELFAREGTRDTVEEYDIVQDRELLDNIVAEAGKVEHAEQTDDPQVNLMEVAAALEAESNIDISQEVPYTEENISSGTDMDSDVLAVGLDEIDDYIPDISETAREETPKKKGMVSKLVAFLMEEDEEPENENLSISDENQEIIREMDGEEAEKSKKKIQKKAKKKDKKKEKKKDAKPKKAKAPKPKKEKKPKEADPYPGRKLSFKKVLPIVLLGISVGAVLFIFVNLTADYTGKQTARTAFAEGDYQTCYTYLHGKERNEKEEQMYSKSECILHIRMWYREYEMLAGEGNDLKALDSLIQSVYEYPALYEYAFRWDAEIEVSEVYNSILDALYGKYGVTEEQAQEIAALKSDIEYTRAVMALAGSSGYGDGSIPSEEAGQSESAGDSAGEAVNPEADGNQSEDGNGQEEELPDELPEEAEMEPEDYVDNQ